MPAHHGGGEHHIVERRVADPVGVDHGGSQIRATLAVRRRIGDKVGIDIHREVAARRALQIAGNGDLANRACGEREDGKISQKVRAAVHVVGVVGGHAAAPEVNAEAVVIRNGIAADHIADAVERHHRHTIAAVERDGVPRAGRHAANFISSSSSDIDAVAAVAKVESARRIRPNEVSKHGIVRRAVSEKVDANTEVPRDDVAFERTGSAQRVGGRVVNGDARG